MKNTSKNEVIIQYVYFNIRSQNYEQNETLENLTQSFNNNEPFKRKSPKPKHSLNYVDKKTEELFLPEPVEEEKR